MHASLRPLSRRTAPSRRWLALLTGCLTGCLIGCDGGASSAPLPPVAAVGVYALQSARGSTPPARVHRSIEAETGNVLDVYVTSDTLTLTVDGRYAQRATLETRIATLVVARSTWADRGTFSRVGGALRLESEYLQNVSADGTLVADGVVDLVQDLPREGTTARYRFRRAP